MRNCHLFRFPHALSCLAGSIIVGFYASSVQAEDLLQIYHDAIANDTTFAAARAQSQATYERYPQAIAGLLPLVNFSASKAHITGTNTYNQRSRSLSLTQPIFRWGNWETFSQGKLAATQSEIAVEQANADLIVRIAQAYFEVLAAQDNASFLGSQKKAISEQLEQAKHNFEVGTATITDQQEAQARFDLTTAQEFAAQADLENKRNTLRQIIGRPIGTLNPLSKDVTLNSPQPAIPEPWINSAELNNFNVQIQQLNYEIAQHETHKAVAGHAPTLDLTASRNRNYQTYNTNTQTATTLDTKTNSVAFQLNIPIFSGGATQSKVRETAALEDKAKADLESAKRSAAQSALQAFLGVQSGLAQVGALEAAERSSQLALSSNRVGYDVGIRINIDVLNAQQQLFQTQRDLSKARYDTILSGLRLKAANASLSEQDVAEVNQLLVPPTENNE